MPDIKRRDKRQNNGTSFNKAEYGIGRPVGFNQDPRDLLLRAFYMGPLPNTYTPIYMRADELNVSNQRYELSLPSSSHFLAFVLSRKKKSNSANHGPIFYHWTKSTVLYSNDTRMLHKLNSFLRVESRVEHNSDRNSSERISRSSRHTSRRV